MLLIADDHPLFRAALRDAAPDVTTREAETRDGVLEALENEHDIDLVLLDVHMSGNHGLAGLAAILAQFPAVAVVQVSANEDPLVVRHALDHDVAGCIPKSTGLDERREAIRAVLDCEQWWPPALRGAVVAHAIGPGEYGSRRAPREPDAAAVPGAASGRRSLLHKQIADRLDVQERTIKAHMPAIFEKLGARNRAHAGVILHGLEISDPALRVAG